MATETRLDGRRKERRLKAGLKRYCPAPRTSNRDLDERFRDAFVKLLVRANADLRQGLLDDEPDWPRPAAVANRTTLGAVCAWLEAMPSRC
jgi:hypothetical protein